MYISFHFSTVPEDVNKQTQINIFKKRKKEKKGSNTYMATNVLHFSMLLYKVTLWLDLTKLIQNLNYMATLAYT